MMEGPCTPVSLNVRRSCNIHDDGCEVLSRILAFNNTLKQLELPSNGIGNGGAMFLANALRNYNHTLCVLDLQGA